jgi:hypothetical protein
MNRTGKLLEDRLSDAIVPIVPVVQSGHLRQQHGFSATPSARAAATVMRIGATAFVDT